MSSAIPSKNEFIDLNRTFQELPLTEKEKDDNQISVHFDFGRDLKWSGLLEEYRVIILAEAGSGKTFEIRNACKSVRTEGKASFFLRLEFVAKGFEDAFEIGTYEEFEEWLNSTEEGWLFLDSIDEARLNSPNDFEFAIKQIGRRISKIKERAHIIITGRTTAWRPSADLIYCTNHLGFNIRNRVVESSPEEPFPIDLEVEQTDESELQLVKIVTLNDLSSEQVSRFSKAKGVVNTQEFLDAIERADAWSFTTRPQDLEELTGFWIENGRIGNRLELIKNSLNRRLIERDPSRDLERPLSVDDAHEGARMIAAVGTLTKNPYVRISAGSGTSQGIPIEDILPDWDSRSHSALLMRPLFDEALYGTVGFHHRSAREYLTAEWVRNLLDRESSRRKIESLFFGKQYGQDIILPSMRPILPWLILWNDRLLERVREISPELIFEGGDPSRLPVSTRREILHQVCELIADNRTSSSFHDYTAAQRFAAEDIKDDIRGLMQQYSDSDNVIVFLLRMVWIGQLCDALPEVVEIASNPDSEYYVRKTAFKALYAIGPKEDQERVRQAFYAESDKLDRDQLSTLIKGCEPSAQSIKWLIACLDKCNPKHEHTIDHLEDRLAEFVEETPTELIPSLLIGLEELMGRPPLIERRYCAVSMEYKWVIKAASKAVERLILEHLPEALSDISLSTLNKFTIVSGYQHTDLSEESAMLSGLVQRWGKLNHGLFWYSINRARRLHQGKQAGRLTAFWQSSFSGHLWMFSESDFPYFLDQIKQQPKIDNQLVALSVAFDLYRAEDKPQKWLEELETSTSSSEELHEQLYSYLCPPTRSRDEVEWQKQEAKWKRERQARERETSQFHAEQKEYLQTHINELRQQQVTNPGIISNALSYLFEKTRDKDYATSKLADYSWQELIPEFSEDVALFYKDAVVAFWRNYTPKLISQGAALNRTPYGVIIGLTGLEIESREAEGWPENLTDEDVRLACFYASYELNGFPNWFPRLFDQHTSIVSDFLLQEINFELSFRPTEEDLHYILDDLSWTGEWAWDLIAPKIYKLLKKEPRYLPRLDKMLKIVQGSTVPDADITSLARRKCRTLKKLNHLSHWYAVWVGVDPSNAISAFTSEINAIESEDAKTIFAMNFITSLVGPNRLEESSVRDAYITPVHLKELYLLMLNHIRRDEDIDHHTEGVYTPGLRDHAQEARGNILSILNKIPGKDAYHTLLEISERHPDIDEGSWIWKMAKAKAEQDGDASPWLPAQVVDFHKKLERTPENHSQLAELIVFRLQDLKDNLEQGDSSIASLIKGVTEETEARKYIGHELREKSFGRYVAPQEEELADGKKPDIRIHGNGFDNPVPIELKLANKWSGPKLYERMRNQLCGDYLRDIRSLRGIYLLLNQGGKGKWQIPGGRVDFNDLIKSLESYWEEISKDFPGIDEITVVGIDLSRREHR